MLGSKLSVPAASARQRELLCFFYRTKKSPALAGLKWSESIHFVFGKHRSGLTILPAALLATLVLLLIHSVLLTVFAN